MQKNFKEEKTYYYEYFKRIQRSQTNYREWTRIKNVKFVINQGRSTLESNLLTTQNGFSAVKNAGILFHKKINILMEVLENHD